MKIQEASETLLSRITLRLMEETERERFVRLLEEEHYLKSSRIGAGTCAMWPRPTENGWRS